MGEGGGVGVGGDRSQRMGGGEIDGEVGWGGGGARAGAGGKGTLTSLLVLGFGPLRVAFTPQETNG